MSRCFIQTLTPLLAGFQPPVQQQAWPGIQGKLDPEPSTEHVPTPDGGYQLYKAAGKLKDRKAVITGGDSGIGKATAVLFAMEGADSMISYLPEEEEDAQHTKKLVEKYGRKCYLCPGDLTDKENCKKLIAEAIEKLGAINILFNNHAYQMMTDSILELPDEQWEHTFNTNIHGTLYTSHAHPVIVIVTDLLVLQPSSISPRLPSRT